MENKSPIETDSSTDPANTHLLPQIKSLVGLFLGLVLFSAGFGLLMSVVTIKLSAAGYSDLTTGFVNAAFFLGGIIGSIYCAKYIVGIGHIRTFSAFAALLSAITLVHALLISALSWAILRLASGFLFYGLIMTIESWLNQRAISIWRGRILSLYMLLYFFAYIIGQLLLNIHTHSNSTLFVISGILITLSLVPVALTRSGHAQPVEIQKIQFNRLLQQPRLAIAACFMGGLLEAAFFTLGPLYAIHTGLSMQEMSLFMTSGILGGMIFQMPLGIASDFISRRGLIGASSCLAAIPAFLIAIGSTWPFIVRCSLIFLSGGGFFTLYSLGLAHAIDYTPPDNVPAANRNLLLSNALGAVLGPAIGGILMHVIGSSGLFVLLILSSLTILMFVPTARTLPRQLRKVFVPIPQQTTYAIAKLDPRRSRRWVERTRNIREALFSRNTQKNK